MEFNAAIRQSLLERDVGEFIHLVPELQSMSVIQRPMTAEEYDAAAWEYYQTLPMEHFMEATPQATQRAMFRGIRGIRRLTATQKLLSARAHHSDPRFRWLLAGSAWGTLHGTAHACVWGGRSLVSAQRTTHAVASRLCRKRWLDDLGLEVPGYCMSSLRD